MTNIFNHIYRYTYKYTTPLEICKPAVNFLFAITKLVSFACNRNVWVRFVVHSYSIILSAPFIPIVLLLGVSKTVSHILCLHRKKPIHTCSCIKYDSHVWNAMAAAAAVTTLVITLCIRVFISDNIQFMSFKHAWLDTLIQKFMREGRHLYGDRNILAILTLGINF